MIILPTQKLGFWRFRQHTIQGHLQLFCLLENSLEPTSCISQLPSSFPNAGKQQNNSGKWSCRLGSLPTKIVVTVTSQNIPRFSFAKLNACIVEDMYWQPAYPNDLGWNVAPSLTGCSNLLRMCTGWRYIIWILCSNSIIQTERETTCASSQSCSQGTTGGWNCFFPEVSKHWEWQSSTWNHPPFPKAPTYPSILRIMRLPRSSH